jgi:hypothetical protein
VRQPRQKVRHPKRSSELFLVVVNGDSFQTAVVVNADNSFIGVKAEYGYIGNQCGEPHKDWRLQSQGLRQHEGKAYDVLTIALSSGETRTFYFDIAKFFTR